LWWSAQTCENNYSPISFSDIRYVRTGWLCATPSCWITVSVLSSRTKGDPSLLPYWGVSFTRSIFSPLPCLRQLLSSVSSSSSSRWHQQKLIITGCCGEGGRLQQLRRRRLSRRRQVLTSLGSMIAQRTSSPDVLVRAHTKNAERCSISLLDCNACCTARNEIK